MELLVKDAARLFNVSQKTIYRWIADSGLPAIRINKQYHFNKVELQEWAATHKVNVPVAGLAAQKVPAERLASLSEALQEGGVHYRVGGEDTESVLREVVSLMRLPESLDRDFLLRFLLEREALGSTAVGDGIAIPHVRNPIVLRVTRPAVTLCFLENAADFHALDGKRVGVLFTLVTSTMREHLHILSQLAFALHIPEFKEVVLSQGTREAILEAARKVEGTFVHSDTPGAEERS